jgi:hypothetical protein
MANDLSEDAFIHQRALRRERVDAFSASRRTVSRQARGCDLPITLAEDEITVAFIPFASRRKIELALHLLLQSAEFVAAIAQSLSNA